MYVDNDPVVLAHARALLTSAPGGVTSYVDADARDTGMIIAEAAATLDFRQPVAIIMVDLLNFIERRRHGPVDAVGADGRGAVRQLPGDHAPGQRPGPGPARGRTAVEQLAPQRVTLRSRVGRDRPPGRPGAGRARPGHGAGMAARCGRAGAGSELIPLYAVVARKP